MALGAVATAGLAMLLYTGGGFLRAAGFLIGITFASAGAGLWAGRSASPRAPWVLVVVSMVLATAFAVVWGLSESFRQTATGNALAALFIVAEPAYAGGFLLALIAGSAARAPIAIIAVGAGVISATVWLIPHAQPPVIFAGAAAAVILAGTFGRAEREQHEKRGSDMNGKVAIVTGVGSRGQVGYVVAARLAGAGARVIVSGRGAGVEALAAELAQHGEVIGIRADLLSDDDVTGLIDGTRQRYGRLDALVNVAGGLGTIKPIAETSAAEWRAEIERNAETTLRTCRAALPLLRENGGSIVNFAAPAGERAVRNMGAYSAAKAAVVALTRALALEEKIFGVRVNAIAPGLVDTEQNRRESPNPDEAKFVTREEIADVAVFLASDAAAGVSGEVIHVLGEGLR